MRKIFFQKNSSQLCCGVVHSHKIASAKYNFIIGIEAAIDIGNHIISQNGFRAPEDYADTFIILGEHGVVDKDFVRVLKNMARFRNRLVHLY